MKILKWLTFIVLFSVSLSFSTDSYDSTFEDSTSESAFTFESLIKDSTEGSKFDYYSTVEDSISETIVDYEIFLEESSSENTLDYELIFENSVLESILDYQIALKNSASEDASESSFKYLSYLDAQYKCKRNEHFSICDGNEECQKNCSNYDKEIPCESNCIAGCVCNEGFVRGRSGKCIPTEQCRNPITKFTSQSMNSLFNHCRTNEHFSACKGLPLCQKSCSNYNEPIVCPLICVPGCVCNNWYVIGPAGECIPIEECPIQIKPTSKQSNTLIKESKQSKSRISNLFFENNKDEVSDTFSTVSEDQLSTIPSSDDYCPDEILCSRKCRFTGYKYGICIGVREEHCVCFE